MRSGRFAMHARSLCMLPWQVQNFPFWVCLLQLEANYREQLMKDTFQNKFDELAKGLAQSVTRRDAFKKFGVGLAGMVLACFGEANKAEAGRTPCLPAGSF